MKQVGKMKLILCKPNEMAKVVELPKDHSYKDLKRLLEIESPLTCVSRKIGDTYYDFWCDDEGLYPDKKYLCGICRNAEELLCGNILIARHDGEGNTIGLTEEDVKNILDEHNFICIEDFLNYGGTPNYPCNEDGDVMIVSDYIGFGAVFLKPMGYLLKYTI